MSSSEVSAEPPALPDLIWQGEDLIGKVDALTLVVNLIDGDRRRVSIQARNGTGLNEIDKVDPISERSRSGFLKKLNLDETMRIRVSEILMLIPEKLRGAAKRKKSAEDVPADFYETVATEIIGHLEKENRNMLYVENDDFYTYTPRGVYEPLSPERLSIEMRCGVRRYDDKLRKLWEDGKLGGDDKPEPTSVTENLKREIRATLRDTLVAKFAGVKMNQYIDLLNIRNGILNVATMQIVPHSPEKYFTVQINASYNPEAICPTWIKTLDEIFANDTEELRKEKIKVLRQFFGLCAIPDTSLQKMLIMIGDGANGKDTVLAILMAILGEANFSTVSLDQMHSDFFQFELKDKLVNICTESDSRHPVPEAFIKRITGETPITAARKFKDPVTFKSFVRLIFALNEIPPIHDKSRGFFRRPIVLEFTRSFDEAEQNPNLKGELLRETDGIFLWMLDGLAELRRQGRFMLSMGMQEAIEKFKVENNHVIVFAAECFIPADIGEVSKTAAYACYIDWAEKNGIKKAFSQSRFSKLFRRCVPGIGEDRDNEGRKWSGISFSKNVSEMAVQRFLGNEAFE